MSYRQPSQQTIYMSLRILRKYFGNPHLKEYRQTLANCRDAIGK